MLAQAGASSSVPHNLSYHILATYPHDPNAFTQGLHLERSGTLLESTGLYGQSSIRRVTLASGQVALSESLPANWFGEGVAVVGDTIVQLLWRTRLILLRSVETLSLVRTAPLPGEMAEGWGLTHDGRGMLYATDGSSSLFALNATTLLVERSVTVTLAGAALERLNELEWVNGEVWSNIWYDDRVVAIDPTTGVVRALVDFSQLLPQAQRAALPRGAVLNGIAHDNDVPGSSTFFVTGKLWPTLFHVHLDLPPSPTLPPTPPPVPFCPPASALPLGCSLSAEQRNAGSSCSCGFVWAAECTEPVAVQVHCE